MALFNGCWDKTIYGGIYDVDHAVVLADVSGHDLEGSGASISTVLSHTVSASSYCPTGSTDITLFGMT